MYNGSRNDLLTKSYYEKYKEIQEDLNGLSIEDKYEYLNSLPLREQREYLASLSKNTISGFKDSRQKNRRNKTRSKIRYT